MSAASPFWHRLPSALRRLGAAFPWRLSALGLLLGIWRWRKHLRWRLSSSSPGDEGNESNVPVALVREAEEPKVEAEEPKVEAEEPKAEEMPSSASPPAPAASAASTSASSTASARPKAKESGLARGFFNKAPKKAKKAAAPPAPAPPELGSAASPKAPEKPEDAQSSEAAVREAVLREQEAGVRFFHSCSFREAKASFEKMRRLASEGKLGKEEGQAYRLLANCLDKLNAPEEEIDGAYREAMRLAHQHDDMALSFNVLTGMGSHEVKMEHLDEAEHLYFQSLMLAKRVLTPHEEAIAEGNLGMCLGQMEGRRAECLEHLRKALKLQDGSNTHSTVTLLANYASALSADDRHKEAQKEYENALTLARKIGDRRVEINILANLANLCEHVLSMPEKAQQYRKALKGAEGKGDLCAICLENLDDGRPQIVLQCHHMYHSECFEGVLCSESESRGKCPQCRNSHSRFTLA